MNVLTTMLAAAAEAPVNEFGFMGHSRPWWEELFPLVALGLWFVFCGLLTWIVARSLAARRGASRTVFRVAALTPLLLFWFLFFAANFATGATSFDENAAALARIAPAGYALILATFTVGLTVSSLCKISNKRAAKRALQNSLSDLK